MDKDYAKKMGWLVLGLFALVIVSLAASGLILMLLWNWVAVSLFHAPVLSYPLSVGVVLLIMFVASAFKTSK